MTDRFGERRMLPFGLTVLVAGLGLFAAYALMGVGAGTSLMTLVTIALADVPAADAGIA